MIKLSDYLDYLQKEIIQARKKADENAIEVAKQYAEHEYLKYFKVPRFSMPTIKMDIPLKITDIVSETEYEFDLNNIEFAARLNDKVRNINRLKDLNIPLIKPKDLEDDNFSNIIKNIKNRSNNLNRNLDEQIIRSNLNLPINKFLRNKNIIRLQDSDNNLIELELNKAFTDVIMEYQRPISTRLDDLFIDPDTANSGDHENDKLMVNLHVELVEEAIRIVKMKDKDGNEVEEITFE